MAQECRVINVKRFTGLPHPDRDKQFRYLRRGLEAFQRSGDPVLSVDTKKKELIGEFKNAGRTQRRTPREVNAHDFQQDALFRTAPTGYTIQSTTVGMCMWEWMAIRHNLP